MDQSSNSATTTSSGKNDQNLTNITSSSLSTNNNPTNTINKHRLELHVTETSPRHLELHINAIKKRNSSSGCTSTSFIVSYSRSKSFLGVVSGNDFSTSLEYVIDTTTSNSNTCPTFGGVVALVDGGYNQEEQTCPERKLELMTVEKYPLMVGEWTLPRQKHEHPLRIQMIIGALQTLLSE